MKHIRWWAALGLMLAFSGGHAGAQLIEAWHTDPHNGGVMAVDGQGNLFVAYLVPSDPLHVGPGDGAVTKYSPDGNALWTARFRPHDQKLPYFWLLPRVRPTAIKLDAAGNVYVAGFCEDMPWFVYVDWEDWDYDGNDTKGHFVAKISQDGSLQWIDPIYAYYSPWASPRPPWDPTPQNDIGMMWIPREIDLSPDSSVFVSGQRWVFYPDGWPGKSFVYFLPRCWDPYVAKYTPSGVREWLRSPTYLFNDQTWLEPSRYYAAVTDSGGGVRLVYGRGSPSRTVTAQFSADGVEQWVWPGGEAVPGGATGMATADTQGNVLIVSSVGDGGYPPTVSKFRPDGSRAWEQTVGLPGACWSHPASIVTDGAGNAYVAVRNIGNEIDPNIYRGSVHKLDADGNIDWTQAPGPEESSPAYQAIAVDAAGDVYAGYHFWYYDPATGYWNETAGVLKYANFDGALRWRAEPIKLGNDFAAPNLTLCGGDSFFTIDYLGIAKYVPNTQPGGPVTVQPAPGVSLTFNNVTSPGVTTATTSTTGPQPPEGFRLGNPATYINIQTEAVFTGKITVCINYSGVTYHNESKLALFHYENGAWAPVTTSVDTVNKVICGLVSSLSPFIVAEPKTIDIKPGVYPNTINLGANGTVPVAILSHDGFDAATVDPLTVTLASAPVRLKGKGTPMFSMEDVNADGRLDMVVHVSTEALTLNATDTEAVLSGKTLAGQLFSGADIIRVVP